MVQTIKKAAQAKAQTLPATIYNASAKGLTLIEVIVVMALLAGFTMLALPRMRNSFDLDLRKRARLLSGAIQYAFHQAAFKQAIYRIHYDLDEKSYWIEASDQPVLLQKEDAFHRQREENETGPKKTAFKIQKDMIKKPLKLEKSLSFKDIQTEAKKEPITAGHAYTHFFPHGVAESTRIRLQNTRGHVYTLVVNPLTGKAQIYDRDIEAPLE